MRQALRCALLVQQAGVWRWPSARVHHVHRDDGLVKAASGEVAGDEGEAVAMEKLAVEVQK